MAVVETHKTLTAGLAGYGAGIGTGTYSEIIHAVGC